MTKPQFDMNAAIQALRDGKDWWARMVFSHR